MESSACWNRSEERPSGEGVSRKESRIRERAPPAPAQCSLFTPSNDFQRAGEPVKPNRNATYHHCYFGSQNPLVSTELLTLVAPPESHLGSALALFPRLLYTHTFCQSSRKSLTPVSPALSGAQPADAWASERLLLWGLPSVSSGAPRLPDARRGQTHRMLMGDAQEGWDGREWRCRESGHRQGWPLWKVGGAGRKGRRLSRESRFPLEDSPTGQDLSCSRPLAVLSEGTAWGKQGLRLHTSE